MRRIVIPVLSALITGIISVRMIKKLFSNEMNKLQLMSNKHLALFLMMNQWVRLKQKGQNLKEYFIKRGYQNIAIYGMSYVGETLLEELRDTDIHVLYGIDKNINSIYSDISIVTIDNKLQDVDVIVVTAITFFEEIQKMLSEKVNCAIISLDDILYEL